MPHELPPDPSAERRTRITSWVTFAIAALLVALLTYFAYVGYEGSRQLVEAPGPTADCRTPEMLGWAYEPINYDGAADLALAGETDPTACTTRSAAAGPDLVGPGGTRLAGWWIPAASGDPDAAAVVLVHGWGSNKSQMLERAAMLHDAYDLLLLDLRSHGQSGTALTTQGVHESGDLRAAVDWLAESHAPQAIAVLGVSMGGATALLEAANDDRVAAVVVESTHATLANAIQARLDRAGYPLSTPGSWAILLGALLRTGQDVSAADPVGSIERLDERPVLLIDAGGDETIGPDDASLLHDAAAAAGSPVELRVCAAAGHGTSPETCPEEYGEWVLGFLDRVLTAP